MTQLKFNDDVFTVSSGQTVLETLLGNGIEVPNNCRAGACQSCLMQVTKGKVPEAAQKGLKDSFKAKGYFLACSCIPEENIDICIPDSSQLKTQATVKEINKLSDDVIELKIQTEDQYDYFAGQFVTLWRDDNLGRSYSLASLPENDNLLTFHIRVIPNGAFSGWVDNELQVNDTMWVQGPAGDCFYTQGNAEQNLLLIGTGTGLAPLYGIVRDALQSGHTGDILLFHGALNQYGLYLHDHLTALSEQYIHFKYLPCVVEGDVDMPENITEGDIAKVIFEKVPKPSGWKAFLCGNPELVNDLRKKIYLAGCNMKDIYSDPFIPSEN